MKQFVLIAVWLAFAAHAEVKKEIEIAIDRYEQKACSKAKAQAKQGYDIVEMTGCTCERTDSREWQCFVRFSYNAPEQRSEAEE